jgi:guanylate kinase
VIFDVDVMGGIKLKSIFGDKALSVFVQPPSIQELENRLIGRGSETPETIIRRVGKAEIEMKSASEFDYILINDKLEDAKKEARKTVCNYLEGKDLNSEEKT